MIDVFNKTSVVIRLPGIRLSPGHNRGISETKFIEHEALFTELVEADRIEYQQYEPRRTQPKILRAPPASQVERDNGMHVLEIEDPETRREVLMMKSKNLVSLAKRIGVYTLGDTRDSIETNVIMELFE